MPKKPASRQFRPKKRVRSPRPNRSSKNRKVEDSDCVSEAPNVPSRALSVGDNSELDGPASVDAIPVVLSPCTTATCTAETPISPLYVDTSHGSPSTSTSLFSPGVMSTSSVPFFSPNSCGSCSPSQMTLSDMHQHFDLTTEAPSLTDIENIRSPTLDKEPSSSVTPIESILSPKELQDLLMDANSKIGLFLPQNWISLTSAKGINVMLLSRKEETAIQRRINYSADGKVTLSVHGQPVDIGPFVNDVTLPGPLARNRIDSIVDFIVSVVNRVRALEICSGADYPEFSEAWHNFPSSSIDKNYFQECRYKETLRVDSCKLLVEPRNWRCQECNKAGDRLRKRMVSLTAEEANRHTANIHLSEEQKMKKLKSQRRQIDAGKKKIYRLQQKISRLIESEGMMVEDELSELMTSALRDQKLSPTESLFLQQQLKAKGCKTKSGMRWHPHMIKFALAIFKASPAAYSIIMESGMMRLPHSRTLFDYSHVFEAEEGICLPVINTVHERISKLQGKRFKWHVLMCDEMHISKNIVYHKRSGSVMGFTQLTDVEKDLKDLQKYLDSEEDCDPEIATKMLSFMIKGVCNSIKEVVASFSTTNINKEKLYSLSWKVVCQLERSGIQIIAMISDGNGVNRAFFKMNTPLHPPTTSGVVYSTMNKAAPSRPLFFLSDLPHLVKTIRNNFYNSRLGKKAKRRLTKNGQHIVWETIIRLYHEKKNKTLRKSYKLNLMNVFPDSYSCMKVRNAFQVMSNTVANDIESQGWPNTSETVRFIRWVNNVADCLNGAHSTQGIKTANKLLNPYRDHNDERFEYLLDFLKYLDEWKSEAKQGDSTMNQSAANQTGLGDSFQSLHDIHEDETGTASNDTPHRKKTLCSQTLEGIETTIMGFIGAVRYLLTEGEVGYINARVFCQDPLEQYFSKQRARGGGSCAPNVQRYLENAISIHVQRGLSVEKRTGNSSETYGQAPEISNEKLPKRKKGPDVFL